MSNSAFPIDSIQVSIKGQVPADGSTTWMGSYTITNAASDTSCTFNQSNSFVATAYPPLDGTYAGTIAGQSPDKGLTISAQITQEPLTLIPTSSSSLVRGLKIPLSGTIKVTGSLCFTSGTTTQGTAGSTSLPVLGQVDGDTFLLNYTMNDGSDLQLNGYFADSSESELYVQNAFVFGGKCNGILGGGGNSTYSGDLTRQ